MIASGTLPVRPRLFIWLVLTLTAGVGGCNSRPSATVTASTNRQVDPADELTDAIREELRKSPDQAASRRLVDLINAALPRLAADHRPTPLTAADRSTLQSDFKLLPAEIMEVDRAE